MPPGLEETRPTGFGRARGLVSSRVSGGRIQARTFEPPPALQDLVGSLWAGRWDLRGQPDHETELLSDPSVHIVFEQGDGTPGARVVGVWTKLWRRRLTGQGATYGVKLRPGAVRAFTECSAVTLTDRIVPLEDVFGPAVQPIIGPSERWQTPDDAFSDVTAWLQTVRRSDRPAEVLRAVRLAARAFEERDVYTVEHLSMSTGVSVRLLQRIFQEHVGVPPKLVIRRARLQEAAVRLERGDAVRLVELSVNLGYADQAHFTRDFKQAVGKSPSAFAAAVWT